MAKTTEKLVFGSSGVLNLDVPLIRQRSQNRAETGALTEPRGCRYESLSIQPRTTSHPDTKQIKEISRLRGLEAGVQFDSETTDAPLWSRNVL